VEIEILSRAHHDSAIRRILKKSAFVIETQRENSMAKQVIHTDAAPKAIGTYSQAVRCGSTVYLAGQIGLDPATMEMAAGIEPQIRRVLENLKAVAAAAGGSLDDIVRSRSTLPISGISRASTRSRQCFLPRPTLRAPLSASPVCRAPRWSRWTPS